MTDYANNVLIEPEWLEQHLHDDSVRVVEVDENPALYRDAHIPGAIGFDWREDLQDQVKRDSSDLRTSDGCSEAEASQTTTR